MKNKKFYSSLNSTFYLLIVLGSAGCGADADPSLGADRTAVNTAALNPEVVEGVTFTSSEAEAVVYGVNHADLPTLDSFLDVRAANGLVAARPFSTVAEMGPVPYVGPGALEHLRAQAPQWSIALQNNAPPLAGTFDTVVFDQSTAEIALEITNGATFDQLRQQGVAPGPAHRIVESRPYVSVAQVAEVNGVANLTMISLKSYAESGDWPFSSCVITFSDTVEPYLDDLLFMSESDRPFELVVFPAEGAYPPTGASVLALVGAPAGSVAEERVVENYFRAFEPSGPGADPLAAYAVENAFGEQLTDVIYVAVFAPAGNVVVQVYLVGRTSCGDLVGIRSISIET